MKTIKLQIKEKECKSTCPIPINLIPNIEKGIEKIDYDRKTGVAKIVYNEKLLSERQIISKLRKIGYGVKK